MLLTSVAMIKKTLTAEQHWLFSIGRSAYQKAMVRRLIHEPAAPIPSFFRCSSDFLRYKPPSHQNQVRLLEQSWCQHFPLDLSTLGYRNPLMTDHQHSVISSTPTNPARTGSIPPIPSESR
jgi:hypothetical protein